MKFLSLVRAIVLAPLFAFGPGLVLAADHDSQGLDEPNANGKSYVLEIGAKREAGLSGGRRAPNVSPPVMEKIAIPVGGKTLLLQFGAGEFYLKLADALGNIAFVEATDLPVIADIAQAINRSPETDEDALKALETLYSWPPNLPVYQWTDAAESIFPVNDREFAVESLQGGETESPARKKPKARLRAATDGELLDKLAREFPPLDPLSAGAKSPRAAKRPLAPSGSSLCAAIGASRVATYPSDIGVFPPRVEYASVTAPIEPWWTGGGDCLGRCGQGCSGAIPGVSSNSDVYTKACHNHDVCVDHEGLFSAECNYIFAKAAASAFGDNCSSLMVEGPKKVQDNSSTDYVTNLLVAKKKLDMTGNPNLTWRLTSDLSSDYLAPIGATEGIVVQDLPKGAYRLTILAKFSRQGLERQIRKKINIRAK
jgi:hypothetical protein